MSALVKLFNTRTRSLEQFSPIDKAEVQIYCCGPTVYNFQHIGNLRTYIFEDVLVRTLRYAGYPVKHVMNITDVGHLVSDADEGEDKMSIAARREGKTSLEIASYYTKVFFQDSKKLNILRPDLVCKASEHIPEMIKLIEKLEQKGFAYQAGGNVYFDVSKFPSYGDFAGLDLAALQAGARIEIDSKKNNPHDFVLWFTKSKFENQELVWDSPWGRGYPGWHIECSAMAKKYLGDSFDIHCGGIDHIPVHHTNEIAQSEAATGKQMANFWMHGRFLLSNKDKMSKSKGGFLTLEMVEKEGFEPSAYRLFCLGGSYRKELSFSWEALSASQNRLNSLKEKFFDLKNSASPKDGPVDQEALAKLSQESALMDKFKQAMFKDLGTPAALTLLQKTLEDKNLGASVRLLLVKEFDQVLGLDIENWKEQQAAPAPTQVKELLELRNQARQAKDWNKADELRDQILSLGWVIKDGSSGAQLKKR